MPKESVQIPSIPSDAKSRKPLLVWVCEWEIAGIGKPRSGKFVVAASHYLGAKQMAKKLLRDELALSGQVTFEVRRVNPGEDINADDLYWSKLVPFRRPLKNLVAILEAKIRTFSAKKSVGQTSKA